MNCQVYRIVCKSAWGKLSTRTVTGGKEEQFWTLVHDQLTFTKPENPSLIGNLPEGEDLSNLVSYQDYLDILYRKKADGTYDPEIE